MIFHKIKVAKHIWDQCCHLAAETGSWFPSAKTVLLKSYKLWDILYPPLNAHICLLVKSGNPYWCGRHSTVNLLVLTSLGKLHLILKIYVSFWQNKFILMRRSTVLSLPGPRGFPGHVGASHSGLFIGHWSASTRRYLEVRPSPFNVFPSSLIVFTLK